MSSGTDSRGGTRRVPDWLLWRSLVTPDALALKAGSLEWSYAELNEKVSALSATLLSRGVRRGRRVALLARPTEAYVSLVHAVARIGAITVPLNHRQSRKELLSQLRDSGTSLVVYGDEDGGAPGARARELREEEDDEEVKEEKGREGPPRRWVKASELMRESAAFALDHPVAHGGLDLFAPHTIIYTSGSSGTPKGVELTLSNIMWNAISVGLRTGALSTDRWLLCMPLFHVGGYAIIFRALLHGSGIVLHPVFDPKRVSESLDTAGVTLASFVPTMLHEVLVQRGTTPLAPGVRFIFLGGGPPPPHLLATIRKRKIPVLLTYGMTETCSQVAASAVSSAGPYLGYNPLFPSEVAVVKSGAGSRGVEPVGPGEVGEVAVRGPSIFRGYWRKPNLTRLKFRKGWFLTGDLGVVEERGIAVLGRKEETIVTGGEKVFPAEVESALREHPAVADAVVVGVEDARWGQRVVAVLETRGDDASFRDNAPSGDELTEFLRERLGRYKIPKQYHFWRTLPRTSAGKTRRAEVRHRLLEGGREKEEEMRPEG